MVYYGKYECEFNQTVDIEQSPKYSAYVTVKHGKGEWLMKPVLSSTGAIRLEDVRGETLMVQIASKSMLLNTMTARRIVDDCISPKQREHDRGRQGGQGGLRRVLIRRSRPAARGSRVALHLRRRLDNGRHAAPLQLQPGPRRPPRTRSAPGRERNARLERHRRVGDGAEPSRQGVHGAAGRHRGRPARAARASRRTTRCCSCRAARSARTRSCR